MISCLTFSSFNFSESLHSNPSSSVSPRSVYFCTQLGGWIKQDVIPGIPWLSALKSIDLFLPNHYIEASSGQAGLQRDGLKPPAPAWAELS